MLKYKKTAPVFLYFEGQMHLGLSVFFCFFCLFRCLCRSVVKIMFRIDLHTCYKINGYFKFQIFTHHLFSVFKKMWIVV